MVTFCRGRKCLLLDCSSNQTYLDTIEKISRMNKLSIIDKFCKKGGLWWPLLSERTILTQEEAAAIHSAVL